MERAIITISESGNVNIPDGDVWMSFAELVGLFDVAVPTHIKVYNMDMIAALAFRINSYGAEKIRGELLKRIYGRKEKVCYLFSLANSPIGMS